MTDTQATGSTSKRALTIDERIEAMEAALPRSNVAGTTLSRVFKETQGLEWCLALGSMQMPKSFFRGPSIEDVVSQGERAIAAMKSGGGNRLETDWDKLDVVLAGAAVTQADWPE